jgi:flagellar biosynthesis protein FliR
MALEALTGLFSLAPLALLVFARIVALFAVGPVLGASNVPPQVKALLATALTAIVVPTQLAQQPPPPLDGRFVVLLVQEVLVGLTLGFFIDLFMQAIRFGGDLINRHIGFAAGEYFNPDLEDVSSPIGDLFYITAALLFVITNGHHFFITAMSSSYSVVPLGGFAPTPQLYAAMVSGSQQLYVIALTVSFPLLGITLALTLAEGVIVRAVPQINFMHFGFAVKILIGMMVLWAGIPAAVAFLAMVLAAMQEAGYALLKVMG